ncbi:MAG: radical SAM protein [Pseudomonadota bacterium]
MKGKIRNIVLLEPKASANHIFSRIIIPRLGNPILGTMLAQRGYNVRVIAEEVTPIRLEEVLRADLVCISSITSTAPNAYIWADKVRAAGKLVVMGGVHPTFVPNEALLHADYVVRGEGEGALMELVEALDEGGSVSHIANLSYLDHGEPRHNPLRPLLCDLDSVPMPDYSLLAGWPRKTRVLPVSTSRGCPYNCAFCSVVPMFGRQYRFTSIDRTMEEIRLGMRRSKHIFFVDDNFTANPARTKQILEQSLSEGLKLNWSAQVRAEIARDSELLKLMRRSNCFTVFVGFESINPRTLKLYNKRQSLDDIREAMANFRANGINVHGMFVFGADEDGPETIRETVNFAREAGIASVQFLILTPLPGTRMYDQIEAEGRITDRDWSHYDAHHTVYMPKRMTPYELQNETFKAMNRFYSWPAIGKSVLTGNVYYAYIGLYGKRSLSCAKRTQSDYLSELKDSLNVRVEQLKRALGLDGRHVSSVAVPAVVSETAAKDEERDEERSKLDFFLSFLRNLGIKLVLTASGGKQQDPSEKVELVLIPAREVAAQQPATDRARASLRKLLVDLRSVDFYTTCMEVGLVLGRKAAEIKDAYRAATDESKARV